ncbi:family 2 glycosyl transferase [Paenibacillus elgii]|uniref:Family 2 glycosyl transferase n=1 Tax=Paenibacillus elgii TaxID=189691 RepID=A0A2T6FRH9_9BACL|nr:glycosyltransferase family 2 protein [Paenibacillus elgii]PUA34497.1 family 2 glycosyl transferase [Paenibacillus elgii]
MKVSVCMIVKNEQDCIKNALASIPPDYEVIVLDTGSTDQTIQIAQSSGAIVKSYAWNDNFSDARNYCHSFATGDYILILDSDETLPANTNEIVNQFVLQYPKMCASVFIKNLMEDEIKTHRMVRFYPNDGMYLFHGIVHEQVYYKDAPAEFKPMNLTVTHYGYEQEHYDQKNKISRYLPLYKKHLEENPNDGYMLYQMGKIYFAQNDYSSTIRYLMQSLNIGEADRLYFPVALVMLGYALKETGRSLEAEQLLVNFENDYPDFPDLPFLQGLLAMDTGNIQRIAPAFQRALAIGESTKYTSVAGVGTYKAAYNLGVYYEIVGNTSKAKEYYLSSASEGYKPAVERLKFL